MLKKQIAVCDSEQEYVRRLVQYVNARKDSLFLLHGFSNPEELMTYTKEHPPEMVLLDEKFSDRAGEFDGSCKVMLLTDQKYCDSSTYPMINRLLPASRLLRQVMDFCAENSDRGFGEALRTGKLKRIGIYSPVGRSGKTEFALALGRELSRKMRVLYLNLEEYSGFSVLHPNPEENTLSELMYFLKQGKGTFACKLESLVQKTGGLDYIPPLRSPVEFKHIEYADWEELLETLSRESRYELVILDLCGAVNGLFELLESCDRIYMPVEEDETAAAKVKQYEETLNMLGLDEVSEHTEKIHLNRGMTADSEAREKGRRWIENDEDS